MRTCAFATCDEPATSGPCCAFHAKEMKAGAARAVADVAAEPKDVIDLGAIYAAIDNDADTAMLDGILERAGIFWVCECKWRNVSGQATCGDCGAKKGGAS